METTTKMELGDFNNAVQDGGIVCHDLHIAVACRRLILTGGDGVPLCSRDVTRILGAEDDRRQGECDHYEEMEATE